MDASCFSPIGTPQQTKIKVGGLSNNDRAVNDGNDIISPGSPSDRNPHLSTTVHCSKEKEKNFESLVAQPSSSKKHSHLLKLFLRHFARKKTSFLNSWSTIVNSNLLEECISGIIPERLEKSPPKSCSFFHSKFQIPGSNVLFVQGIQSNFLSNHSLEGWIMMVNQ